MPRIILIDVNSGYIWGDSANHEGKVFGWDDAILVRPDAKTTDDFALAYAEALDRHISPGIERDYEMHGAHRGRDGASGYWAYRTDINGSEAVAIVHDGQSQEAIEAVEDVCQLLGFIETSDQ